MKFSIIIPSFNQPAYIQETLENVSGIKKEARDHGLEVEILLFDSESGPEVQGIIGKFSSVIDHIEVKKDKGQFDAINKGILKSSGDYWTWLNTDDLLDKEGFFRTAEILRQDPSIDYIYGSVDYINEQSKFIRAYPAYRIDQQTLITKVPGIFQQGSFFRKAFTDKIGVLREFNCCFDYEYVLRCLKNGAKMYVCNFKVASFRYHGGSKTGSLIPMFIRDQLAISKEYGRKWYHYLSWFSQLRLIKHQLFPRK